MKILVIYSRIYSVEYELIEMPGEKILAKGRIEKIGLKTGIITYNHGGAEDKIIEPVMGHEGAVRRIMELLTGKDTGVLADIKEIKAVGHRIVHGGNKFYESVLITPEVENEIRKDISLAPLHNPYNLKGIQSCRKLLPQAKNVAVFGTAFYRKMPDRAHYYALPRRLVRQYGIVRYGFHGISNQYSVEMSAKILKKPKKAINIIVCHLGYGSSVTAIRNGIPIDTSMGFSPLGGVMMATRCGNIDPEVILHLMNKGWTTNEITVCLNRECGLLGVSGVSDDMREVIEAEREGNPDAKKAIDMYCYQVRKYIGSYYAALEGKCDALSFTAGIGVNSPYIRNKICSGLKAFGIKLNASANSAAVGKKAKISDKSSKIAVIAIPRDEVVLIARETVKVLRAGSKK